MVVTYELNGLDEDIHTQHALRELSQLVSNSKRILIVTGAGVSCSSGIPDFRSAEGLYSLIKKREPDAVSRGQDLFDVSVFRNPKSTASFYSFIAELKTAIDNSHPSPTHRFIKTLDIQNKLLRSYTQNIDGYEAREGLLCSSSVGLRGANEGKLENVMNVQLHGDIHCTRCTICSAHYSCSQQILDSFRTGVGPECPECVQRSDDRVARSARPLRVGSLRPAIVLYGEQHPYGDEIGAICAMDMKRDPDLLIVIGTSLKVQGIKTLVKDFAKAVHAPASPRRTRGGGKVLFVNTTPPAAEWESIIDIHVAGPADEWVGNTIRDWESKTSAGKGRSAIDPEI